MKNLITQGGVGFTTRIKLEDTNIEVVDQMKILGTTINNSLTWNTNTDEIIKKVNKRMLLLKKIKKFWSLNQ